MTSPTTTVGSMGKGAAVPLCTVCGEPIKRTKYRRNGGQQQRWVHVERGGGHKVQVSERGVGYLKCLGCKQPAADHDWWAPCPQ